MSTINQFIEDKIKEEYQPIFSKFKGLINAKFPMLKEEMRGGTEKYYGVPVYRHNSIIITVSPTKKGITFSFTDGKQFEDKYNLLEGVGNKSLNLRLSDPKDFKDDIFEYYILQAIDLDR
ncbi:DUF1801 domain-containing protein [Allomuricauda sp. F6463D]|uniref:DUF1801 domain-containing protein n=1 Tax=Allomuricauda sp. F6463D TaxID=2926409 RepID=UPI001FF2C2BC|nr:DUF1801 domain-containing protein [Muricauda sp. F6463D]MCK0159629.1 DUF1801 domain-containing protein [Muricauda sp. F6463D]